MHSANMLSRLEEELPSNIRIKHSPRARRLALRLDPKDRVVNLVIPKGVSLNKAHDFMKFHETWIKKAMMELPAPIPYKDGRIIPILGSDRRIVINYDPSLQTTEIELSPRRLYVHTNKKDPSVRIERFLKDYSREIITDIAKAKAIILKKKIKSVQIRDTKSRWGSCSADGKLSFSWRLIFAPTLALDYVVAHEVAHLVHLDHSTRFWNLCRDMSVDFVEGEHWMRNYGHELMRYGQLR